MSAMLAWRTLSPSTRLITIYGAVCGTGAAFAFGAAPQFITDAYLGRSLPILNRAFHSHRSLPLGHYLEAWREIGVAVLIAIALHLVTVLVILRLNRSHPSPEDRPSAADGVLIVFSAIFLLTTVLTGLDGDYYAYDEEWRSILSGHDPWQIITRPFNAYGPLFNLMAMMTSLSPIANKLIFSFSYILYVIWMTKWRSQNSEPNIPRWFLFALLILNPFPWVEISWLGYFDILVGLACVAALHSLPEKKDRLSGVFLALGILLKFMPIVILPFLAFSGRRFNWRLVGVCIALVAFGFLGAVLVWGTSVFTPLHFVATRSPQRSIYAILYSSHSMSQLIYSNFHFNWLERSLLLFSVLAIFILYRMRYIGLRLSSALAVLTTLLFNKLGYANYQMVFLCLITYWMVSEWKYVNRRLLIGAFLMVYFTFMAAKDLDLGAAAGWPPVLHPNGMVLTAFVLGCLLLAGLLRFSLTPAGDEATGPRQV